MGPYGTIWDHMGPYGTIWNPWDPWDPWDHGTLGTHGIHRTLRDSEGLWDFSWRVYMWPSECMCAMGEEEEEEKRILD